jgi:dolichyl-phosphate-mannose--protein O-mannosyl transferase
VGVCLLIAFLGMAWWLRILYVIIAIIIVILERLRWNDRVITRATRDSMFLRAISPVYLKHESKDSGLELF